MLTVVCSSQFPLEDFKNKILKTSGLYKDIEFLGYKNDNEFSLTEIYNRGLKEAKYNHIVFCHPDLDIETNNWGKKLLKLFKENSDYGIIGVAGTKQMSETGTWWQDQSKMYGQVKHTHGGKTWLSAYSKDLGTDLEKVVCLDGLFFAVDKTKIKSNFDESVLGFHFYDVTFSLDNYIAGVKLGVTTAIRLNHFSIGQTNEKWEENRLKFVHNYKGVLPISIKRIVRENERLNILIACPYFQKYEGVEKELIELAKSLNKLNCSIVVCSAIGQPLAGLALKENIDLAYITDPPGYKLGDGKWVLQTNNGNVKSEEGVLYKLKDVKFDGMILYHKSIVDHMIKLYPSTPSINYVTDVLDYVDGINKSITTNTDISDVNINLVDSITDGLLIKNILKEIIE